MNLEVAAARVDTEGGLRWLWAAVWVLFALAMGACIANGADGPPDPTLHDAARVEGFGQVAVRVETAAGATEELCALLADTADLRAQGMIGRSDFAGYDAMVFTYDAETTGSYHMRGVPIPLAIAWFDGEGRFVNATEMAPCPEAVGECAERSYPAEGPFRYALEAPGGGLGRLGVGEGSVLHVGGPCGG